MIIVPRISSPAKKSPFVSNAHIVRRPRADVDAVDVQTVSMPVLVMGVVR
jgi:hypothetical protein